VRLKWGQTEYKGQLISVDSYMNIQLNNCVEYIDRKHTGDLGQVLIRYVEDHSKFEHDGLLRCLREEYWANKMRVSIGAIMFYGYQQLRVSK
jgi:hypothetical protein